MLPHIKCSMNFRPAGASSPFSLCFLVLLFIWTYSIFLFWRREEGSSVLGCLYISLLYLLVFLSCYFNRFQFYAYILFCNYNQAPPPTCLQDSSKLKVQSTTLGSIGKCKSELRHTSVLPCQTAGSCSGAGSGSSHGIAGLWNVEGWLSISQKVKQAVWPRKPTPKYNLRAMRTQTHTELTHKWAETPHEWK